VRTSARRVDAHGWSWRCIRLARLKLARTLARTGARQGASQLAGGRLGAGEETSGGRGGADGLAARVKVLGRHVPVAAVGPSAVQGAAAQGEVGGAGVTSSRAPRGDGWGECGISAVVVALECGGQARWSVCHGRGFGARSVMTTVSKDERLLWLVRGSSPVKVQSVVDIGIPVTATKAAELPECVLHPGRRAATDGQ
jgi:hypothetical protein